MSELVLIALSAILVNNFVLVQFLGLCPFMGVSKKIETAIGLSLATTFVLTLAAIASYLLQAYVLRPLDLEFLRTISFIVVIAVVVQFTEMLVQSQSRTVPCARYFPAPDYHQLHRTGRSAAQRQPRRVRLCRLQHQWLCRRSGLFLVLVLFAAMRERIGLSDVPKPFQGAAIGMITAGLMSLAFMGFSGLVKL